MLKLSVALNIIILCLTYGLKEISEVNTTAQKIITPEEQVAIPLDSSQLARYIPKGYVLLDSASGDLNRDQYDDMILVLNKPDEKETSDVSEHPTLRPLLLLIGQPSRTY